MSQHKKVKADWLQKEFDRLAQHDIAWQLYMAALLSRFTELEASLLNSPSMGSDEMRSKIGTLAGLRTALTTPHQLVQELLTQEIQQQETDDDE